MPNLAVHNSFITHKHPDLTPWVKKGIFVDKNYVANMLSDERNPQVQPTQKLISNEHEVFMTDRREAVIMSTTIPNDIEMEDITVRVDNDIVRVLCNNHKHNEMDNTNAMKDTLVSFWLPSVVERHLIQSVRRLGSERLSIIMPKKMTPRKNSIGFDILVDAEINEEQRLMLDGRFAPDDQEDDMSVEDKARMLDNKLQAAEEKRQFQQKQKIVKLRQERMRAMNNAKRLEAEQKRQAEDLEFDIAEKQMKAAIRRAVGLNVEKARLHDHNVRVAETSPAETQRDSDAAQVALERKLSDATHHRHVQMTSGEVRTVENGHTLHKRVDKVSTASEQGVASSLQASAMALKQKAANKSRQKTEHATNAPSSEQSQHTMRIH